MHLCDLLRPSVQFFGLAGQERVNAVPRLPSGRGVNTFPDTHTQTETDVHTHLVSQQRDSLVTQPAGQRTVDPSDNCYHFGRRSQSKFYANANHVYMYVTLAS